MAFFFLHKCKLTNQSIKFIIRKKQSTCKLFTRWQKPANRFVSARKKNIRSNQMCCLYFKNLRHFNCCKYFYWKRIAYGSCCFFSFFIKPKITIWTLRWNIKSFFIEDVKFPNTEKTVMFMELLEDIIRCKFDGHWVKMNNTSRKALQCSKWSNYDIDRPNLLDFGVVN